MRVLKWLKRIGIWLLSITLTVVLGISATLYFFHDDIVNYVVGEVNKHLNAKVEVSKVDISFWSTFPNLSVDFNHVFIPDALSKSSKPDTLLYSELIQLKFDPIDIWNENYRVKAVEIYPGTVKLRINSEGIHNFDILKEDTTASESDFELTLEYINATNLRFIYSNIPQEQFYKTNFKQLALSGQFSANQTTIHASSDFFIHRIAQGKIPFIRNQKVTAEIDLLVDNEKQTVKLPTSTVYLAKLPFQVGFYVDTSNVHLNVQAKSLSLQDVANKFSVEEAQEVNKYKGSGTVSVNLVLDSPRNSSTIPKINCQFDIKNGELTEPSQNLVLRNIQLNGDFSTLKGKGNEELNLRQVRFSTIGGPFSGNLGIRKFSAPRYTGIAVGTINLAIIHSLFHLPKIDVISGNVAVNTMFVLSTITAENGSQSVEIEEGNGIAEFKNVGVKLENDSRKMEQINGKVILDRRQAALENLGVRLGKSDILLNGVFDKIDLFLQDKSNLDIQVTAQSRLIDLEDFNSTAASNEQRKSTESKRSWLLPDKIAGNVRLDLDKIILEGHQFIDLHGDMIVANRSIRINQLTGKNAQASVQGELVIIETSPEYFELKTSLSSKNIQFKPVFTEWHNFDQKVITTENISGKAEVILDFKAPFDMRKGVIKDEIVAQIQLKVYNGNLRNVGAFNDLTASLKTPKTRLVLKKREIEALEGKLGNISFETLENTIFIKNSKVIIPSMIIHSSAFDITTEGTHTFSNNVDYRFAFRLRELKQLKDDSEFGEVIDDGTGIRLYVRMFGSLDNPTIEWDGMARKDQAKENREEAKKEVLSILKSEFGFKKNDTLIKAYQHKIQPREELRIEFGKEQEVDPVQEKKKTNKFLEEIKKKTEKLREKQPKEEIEIE